MVPATSRYRLKHLRESRRHKFFPELLVSYTCYTPVEKECGVTSLGFLETLNPAPSPASRHMIDVQSFCLGIAVDRTTLKRFAKGPPHS